MFFGICVTVLCIWEYITSLVISWYVISDHDHSEWNWSCHCQANHSLKHSLSDCYFLFFDIIHCLIQKGYKMYSDGDFTCRSSTVIGLFVFYRVSFFVFLLLFFLSISELPFAWILSVTNDCFIIYPVEYVREMRLRCWMGDLVCSFEITLRGLECWFVRF